MFNNFGGGQQDNSSSHKGFGWGGIGLGESLRTKLQEQAQDLASKAAAVTSQVQNESVLRSSFWQEPTEQQQQQVEIAHTSPTVASVPPAGTPLFPPSNPPPSVSSDATTVAASNVANTAAPAKTQPLSSRNPDDISKDELMEVLAKMNKRVKQLTLFKNQLTEQNETLKNECTSIKNLISNEILSEFDIEDAKNASPDEKDEVAIYRKAWRFTDERNSLMLQQLQNEFKVMTMKKGAELEKIENQYKQQMERLSQQHATESNSSEEVIVLNQKLQNMENKIKENDEEWKAKMESQKCTMEANFQSDLKLFIAEAVATNKTQWEADKEALESKNDANLESIKQQVTKKEEKIRELEKKLLDQQRGFEEEIEKKAKDELKMNMELNKSILELQQVKETQHVQYEKDIKKKLQQFEQMHKEKIEMMQQKHNEDIKSQLENQSQILSDKYKLEILTLKSYNDGIESLQKKLNDACAEINESKQQNKSLEEEITSLKQSLDSIQSEKEQLESTYAKQKQVSEAHGQEEKQLLEQTYQTKIQNMELDYEKLKQEQVDTISQMEQLGKELERSKMEIEDYNQKNQHYKKEIVALKESVKSLQADKERLESTQAKEIEQAQTHLEESNTKLKEEYENKILSINTQYKQQLQDLQTNSYQTRNTLQEQISTMEAKIQSIQNEKDEKLKEIKEKAKAFIQKQKSELEEKHKVQIQSMQSFHEAKLAEVQKEYELQRTQQLEQQKQEYEMKIDLLNNELSSTKSQLETVSSEEGDKGKQMEEALSNQKASYEQYINKLNQSLQEVKSQLENERREFQAKVDNIETFHSRSIEELQTKNKFEAEAIKKQIKLEKDELIQERSKLQESMHQLEKELKDVTEVKNTASKESEEAKLLSEKKIHQLEEALNKLESQYKQHLEEMQRAEQGQSKSISNLQQSIASKDKDIDDLKASLDSATMKNEELKNQYNNLEKQNASLVSKMKKLDAELKNVKSGLEEEKQTQVTKLQEEFKGLQTRHKAEIESLRDQYKADVSQKVEEIIVSKDKDIDDLKASLDSATMKNEELKNQYNDLEKQNASLISKMEELDAKLKNVKSGLEEEKETQVTKLQEELQSLQTSHKDEIESLRDQYKADVSQKVAEAKDAISKELHDNFEQERTKSLADIDLKQKENERELISKYESQVNDLKSEAEVAREERGMLQSQILSLQEQLEKEKERLVTNFRKKLTDFRGESSKAISMKDQEKAEALEQAEATFREKEKELVGQCDLLKEKVMALQKEKEESMETMDMLHATCQSLEEKNRTTVEVMEKEYKELEAKMNSESGVLIEKMKAEYEDKIKSIQLNFENKLMAEKQNLSKSLEASFNAKIQQQSQAMIDLEKEKAQHIAKLKSFFETKTKEIQADHNKALNDLKSELSSKDMQVTKLEAEITSSRSLYSSAVREKEAILMQMQTLRSTEQSLRKTLSLTKNELQETIANSSATASALLEEQDKLRADNSALAEKLTSLKSEYNNSRNEVEELGGKLKALTDNLNCLLEDKKDNDQKLELAQKQEDKLKTAEADLSSLREEVTKLKLEQTKNAGIVARLQAEKDSNERKHGQRTALVGMLEAQLAELNEAHDDANSKLEAALYDLSERDDSIASLKDQLERAESQIKELQQKKREVVHNHTMTSQQNQANNNSDSDAKKSKMVDALQKEVMALQQQMARKSAAAQRLIQEREAECMQLRKANQQLQKEVDVGTLSDKRIIELAAQQSNRDSKAIGDLEVRDKIVKRLTSTLIDRDSDLAEAEYNYQQVADTVEELSRVQRREDVNLDYLKSIIVQFLSKPPGSSERASLLPVIATLLQFDGRDYKAIEQGAQKVSWWGSIVPTVISAPAESERPSSNGFGLTTPRASDLATNNPYYRQEAASLIPTSISNTDPSSEE